MSFKGNFKKKLYTLALFVVFVVSIATPAIATDEVATFDALKAKWQTDEVASTDPIDVKLMGNIVSGSALAQKRAGDITIDGGGYTWTGASETGITTWQDIMMFSSPTTNRISNITMTGFSTSSGEGAAIKLNTPPKIGSTIAITNSNFTSNSAVSGGVIYLDTKGSKTITDSSFTSNTATDNGGAIYDSGSGQFSVVADSKAVTLSGNTAKLGGAIYTNNDSGNASITAQNNDVIFSGNRASSGGSAIYVNGTGETVTLNAASGRTITFADDSSSTYKDGQTIEGTTTGSGYNVNVTGAGTVVFSQSDTITNKASGIYGANVTVGTDSGDKSTLRLTGKAVIKDAKSITIKLGATLTANASNVTVATPGDAVYNDGTYNMTGGTNTIQIYENVSGGGSTLNILGDVIFGEYSSGNRASIGQTNINIGGTNGEYGALYLHDNDGSITAVNGLTLAQNGFINLNDLNWDEKSARPFRNLTISNSQLNGSGGTFVINTNLASNTGDTITLTTASGTAKVQVAFDPFYLTAKEKESVIGSYTFLTVTNGTIAITAKEIKFDQGGSTLTFTPTVLNKDNGTDASNEWKITALSAAGSEEPVKKEVSETTKSVGDTASMMSFAWINTINNLQKRMGDLCGGEASNMAWARFQRNNDDVNVGRGQSLSGNLYQVGYDFLIGSNNVANNYFGLSFDVFDGTQSFEIGGGDAKSMTLSAYYTKIYESGHYFDFIFRYGRFESDTQSYDTTLTDPVLTKLDYAMNSLTLSGEYGYRANLGKGGLYLEPQAEFIYGYLASAKATSSTGTIADIDSANHFVGRLGLAFGQRVKNFNYYLRGSYYHDFAGTTHVKYGEMQYKQDGAQNWWEVTLGGGWNISRVSYFYAELTKHFKDISNSLNFNLGFRLTL